MHRKSSTRIVSIDFLKSIAIFGVVFIHSRDGNYISEIISEIFRVSVPIFIIFFTYFLEQSLSKTSNTKEYYNVLKQRFYKLFIPYAFFTVIYFFLFNDMTTIKIHDLISGYWSGYGWSGQYFFIILFQLIIIYPLLQKLSNLSQSSLIVLLLIFILFYGLSTCVLWDYSIIQKISDRVFIYWIPYALLGILLFKRKVNLPIDLMKFSWFIFILFIPIEFYLLEIYTIEHSVYILPSVLIAASTLSVCTVYNNHIISKKLSKNLKKASIYISQRSLGIFVLNPLVIYLLKDNILYFQSNNVFFDSLIVLIFALVVFSFSIVLVNILSKTFFKSLVVNS